MKNVKSTATGNSVQQPAARSHADELRWSSYARRFAQGERRAHIFRDLILADAAAAERREGLSILDIGCGGGFDKSAPVQECIGRVADRYIGVEPDPEIKVADVFDSTYRCCFEDASIEPESIDIAFSVMVLEHFEHPQEFWNKVHATLKDGGVFWGFTVDARHWFVTASLLMERLRIKDAYLDMLHGKRGESRYANYGVFYRTNTPDQIAALTSEFSSTTVLNFHRVGQLDYYFPPALRWVGRTVDRLAGAMGLPGSILAVRVEK